MLYDALLIAAYRVSLRGLGAELVGGVQTSPARRGLKEIVRSE